LAVDSVRLGEFDHPRVTGTPSGLSGDPAPRRFDQAVTKAECVEYGFPQVLLV
jgi:hypothetical protein